VTELVQQLLNALSVGSEYALLALGLALVFSIMGFVNFAHGELITIAGYTMLGFAAVGVPVWGLLPIGLAAAVIGSVLMERMAFAPVRNAPPNTMLLTSFGVGIIIQSLIPVFVATRAQAVDTPAALRHVFRVGELNVPLLQLLEMAVTALALVGLAALLRRTTLGLSMRAAAKDFDTVRLMGVNANRVIVTAFALAGFFAGLAAIFIIVRRGAVDAFMGVGPVIKAFVAVVLGGMGSLSAAVLGGLVLGGAETLLSAYLPNAIVPYQDAILFAAVGLVLVLRPQGLFGTEKEFAG